jgi:hypothetical protein
VAVEQVAPAAVAELGGAAGGLHDIGEEHGDQNAIGLRRAALA